MEDYAQYLAEEAKSDVVALHQFRILYEPDRDDFHFFFEGEEDSLFYMPEARRHLRDRGAFIYDCGGKRNVIEVRDIIEAEGYDIRYCLFFIDRDYDDYLGTQVGVDQYTYITDNYSIESDISTLANARILLDDVVRLSKADPEYARIDAALGAAFSKFYSIVRPLMAWILASKEEGCGLNLRNTTGLKGIVSISQMQPRRTKAGFIAFKRKVVVNGQLPRMSTTLKWRRQLDPTSPKLWVRGKYDIWFFQVALLSALEEASERRKQSGGRALRVPASLRDGRLFEVVGGRTPPPKSLQEFFQVRLD